MRILPRHLKIEGRFFQANILPNGVDYVATDFSELRNVSNVLENVWKKFTSHGRFRPSSFNERETAIESSDMLERFMHRDAH